MRTAIRLRVGLTVLTLATLLVPVLEPQDARGAKPAAGNPVQPSPGSAERPPLLRWDLLRRTHYNPPQPVVWPDSLRLMNGRQVRMEGYLMPNFGAQDPGDLLLTGIHPRSLHCGPTDMTAIVEMYLADYDYDGWPENPVEVVGMFYLSRTPTDMYSIYRLYGYSWKLLRRWEQDFPGVVEEILDPDASGP